MEYVAALTSQQPDQIIGLTKDQALLGGHLTCSPAVLQKWWHAIRVTALWNIWLDHLAASFNNGASKQRTKVRIWYQLRTCLQSEWENYAQQIRKGITAKLVPQHSFLFDFGSHAKVCNFDTWDLNPIRFTLPQFLAGVAALFLRKSLAGSCVLGQS